MARSHPVHRLSDRENPEGSKELVELQEKVRRYELIFKATHDVLYDLDLVQGQVTWNDALYSQYGYDRSEPTETLEWWTSHVHPDDALLLEHKLTDVVTSDTSSWQYDYRFRRADGGYNYVRDRGLLIRDDGGLPIRIIGSLLDMTAQKQLDTAKDEFISLVSHQLRTPLTVIRVYGEMLTSGMSGDLSVEQAQWVHNMTNSSARLIDVVGDILNVSRLDLGRINIAVRPHDIVQLVAGCIRDVQPLADDKKITIEYPSAKMQREVQLDEAIFTQIVHNLLTNAIRYSAPVKGKITVAVKSQHNGYVVSVQDNGIGIPKDAQPHVFERFYRAKNAVTTEAQGSGLGLYLVRVMCEAYGGKVWFETVAKKGTTFYMQIPKSGMIPSKP